MADNFGKDRDDVRSHNQVKCYPSGGAQGGAAIQAVSRAMGENDGTTGYRTIIRETHEGTAIARTRDGMPMVEIVKPGENLYLESGHLEFSAPGELNPDRLAPAKWRVLDIDPSGDYLGEIYANDEDVGTQVEEQPTPIDPPNPGVLRDNIDSLAIGYERSTNSAADYKAKIAAGDKTVLKKIVVGLFPPSMWSGKMRLFMQAQYGMKQDSDCWFFMPEMLGESALLNYTTASGTLQFGWWSHKSPGIYSDGKGNYWLLDIHLGSGTAFEIDAYPIVPQDDATDYLLQAYNATSPAPTEAEKTKIEAYLFAHSIIDLGKKKQIGTYDPGVPGGAIAYGWKFNSTGSQARVNLTRTLDAGTANARFNTCQVTLDITYIPLTKVWTVSGNKTAGADWTDGWGVYNIFIPPEPLGSSMELYSIAIERPNVKAAFSFSAVEIYGYYVNDVWKSVTVSRTVLEGPFPVNIWSGTGQLFHPELPSGFVANRYQYGYTAAEDWTYEQHELYAGDNMTLTVGSNTYAGKSEYGKHAYVSATFGSPGSVSAKFIDFYARQTGSAVYFPPSPPGYPPAGPFPMYGAYVAVQRAAWEMTSISYTGWAYEKWVLVIPKGDAEAVYVSIYESSTSSSGTVTKSVSSSPALTVHMVCYPSGGGAPQIFTPWAPYIPGWYGDTNRTSVVTYPAPPPGPDVVVYCYNNALLGTVGTPGGSYDGLYNVAQNYPQYDRTMTCYTSHGLRYTFSDGPTSPASVPTSPRFVGWA
jgi:hypothetical protein